MPGRAFTRESYRFGFQGQEEDSETGLVNYKYRMHDPRLGRFFAVDPLLAAYPWNSPYAFSENRVIDGIELEGLEFYKNNNHYSIGNPKLVNKDALFIKTSVFKSVGFQNYLASIVILKKQSAAGFNDGAGAATTAYDNLIYPAVYNTNYVMKASGKISSLQYMKNVGKLRGLSRISAVTGVGGVLIDAWDRGASDGREAGVNIKTGQIPSSP